MKPETQIAEENLKMANNKKCDWIVSHKATCQRFLKSFGDELRKDIREDLKQAIKLYDEAGIK